MMLTFLQRVIPSLTIHLEEAEDFVVQELPHLQLLAGLQEGLGHILPAGIGDVNK